MDLGYQFRIFFVVNYQKILRCCVLLELLFRNYNFLFVLICYMLSRFLFNRKIFVALQIQICRIT